MRRKFIQSVRESRFLFADDPLILALLEDFNVRSFQIIGFIDELSKSGLAAMFGPDYVKLFNEKEANMRWIMASTERLEAMLVPYLAFRHREFGFIQRFRLGLRRTKQR